MDDTLGCSFVGTLAAAVRARVGACVALVYECLRGLVCSACMPDCSGVRLGEWMWPVAAHAT